MVSEPRLIEDRYLDGTRLRLRHVRVGDGSVFKLTQKVRLDADDPFDVALTNMYLEAGEYRRLAQLPGADLRKTRSVCFVGANRFVLDEFHGHLQGLCLVEIDVADLAEELVLPTWLGAEVTHDDRFSGGSLARASAEQIARLLRLG
jgi:CYTH domain-containing protein